MLIVSILLQCKGTFKQELELKDAYIDQHSYVTTHLPGVALLVSALAATPPPSKVLSAFQTKQMKNTMNAL